MLLCGQQQIVRHTHVLVCWCAAQQHTLQQATLPENFERPKTILVWLQRVHTYTVHSASPTSCSLHSASPTTSCTLSTTCNTLYTQHHLQHAVHSAPPATRCTLSITYNTLHTQHHLQHAVHSASPTTRCTLSTTYNTLYSS